MEPQTVNATQPQKAATMQVQPNLDQVTTQTVDGRAQRLRGGGAGRDCFLGIIECFLCFECCKGCCECVADIICCPCEMCC
ncbi:hypothetical protein AURDEDRAFT_165107 [Auricularia subglabra TFB-10046 SS5]|nr:hypothetical protein AURDEDRAFT_165107 [Auricularia subglabra TFB-10046 SS5]